ncbi:phosphotransferase family protein [Azospirillum halopraeferens]|uniref:phosphotransferase family protein n=1 Tax=Azospirillum halopraeferens TaxID=34010 RepID=UPI0004024E93|nr:phosphotransferase [Azospirillum halopraeferens]
MPVDADTRRAVGNLLAAAGRTGPFELAAIAGGGNNRALRVDHDDGPLFAKLYFHDPADTRDRLAAEFGFAAFAWARGVRALPQPLARDPMRRIGLYTHAPGARLPAGTVDATAVAAALAFHVDVNRHKDHPEARVLRPGSEACFSLADHLGVIDRRLRRLAAMQPADALHRDAIAFVEASMRPAAEVLHRHITDGARRLRLDPAEPLAEADRCLSASDFGFHNALIDDSGQFAFIDFEYAGWDDPAKVIGDFFSQVEVPVPETFLPAFADALAAGQTDPERERRRFDLLLPLYRLKWTCILLNDFLPAGDNRRRFARPDTDDGVRRMAQLDKARAMLRRAVP